MVCAGFGASIILLHALIQMQCAHFHLVNKSVLNCNSFLLAWLVCTRLYIARLSVLGLLY